MLNRQIQVKTSLLGLAGTANVTEMFPNVPGEINLGALPAHGNSVTNSLASLQYGAVGREGQGF